MPYMPEARTVSLYNIFVKVEDIKNHANEIEQRIDDTCCTMDSVLADNANYLEMCQKYNCNYILIDDCYQVDIDQFDNENINAYRSY